MRYPSVTVAAAISALLAAGTAVAQDEERKLYIFNWSQYMDPEIIEQFEAEYDVDVVENFFNSNAEMFSKMQAGGASQYDVVMPSNYFIPRLVDSGLIQPLDHSQIPNMDNLSPKFRDPSYDPGNEYSAAYQWGTTGIVYRTDTIPDAPESWSILFDPELNPNQPFALMGGEGNPTVASACAYLGHGYRCTDREQWTEAARLLLETKRRDNFSGFEDGTPQLQQIARGVIHAGMTYNGDYVYYRSEDPEAYANTSYIIPEEGAEIWVDNMVIPSEAPNPELAHTFINYILDAEIGAQLSNWTYYSSPNRAALPMLEPLLQEPPSTPTEEEMARLEFIPILQGEDLRVFQQIWSEVLSR
ncbi:ABC transporter substrate-binding protein [Spiribacter halobius]|uniref:Putrescine-binding periplasmic protein n=1 Tax=Sediminicurvatus halobius TaxID=2182432 RepID=A0A2U2N200_9GAMM|nr:spermidine/putrescine ABC transporter substrate-binding protein [Spiribacter halobius]PWG63087.1 ABC transporter substrate-binding protein [Spiribacter halobius]UEX77536.1 spermidine/putrescine ABC transporter substrate-binding protein [Spiribacter halobius]